MTKKTLVYLLIIFLFNYSLITITSEPSKIPTPDDKLIRLFRELNQLRPSEVAALINYLPRKQQECLQCCEITENNDDENYILFRGKHYCVSLNKFPATKGCLVFTPYNHIVEQHDLSPEALCEREILKVLSLPILRKNLNDKPKVEEFNLGSHIGSGIHSTDYAKTSYPGEGRGYLEIFGPSTVIPYSLENLYKQLKPEFNNLKLPEILIGKLPELVIKPKNPEQVLLSLCHRLNTLTEKERALWIESKKNIAFRISQREQYRFEKKDPNAPCPFCTQRDEHNDEAHFILHRTNNWMIMLNKKPYGDGGLLFTSVKHVHFPDELSHNAIAELALLKLCSLNIVSNALNVDEFITGCGTGACAGCSVLNHFHEQATPVYDDPKGISLKDNVNYDEIPAIYKKIKPEFEKLKIINVKMSNEQ